MDEVREIQMKSPGNVRILEMRTAPLTARRNRLCGHVTLLHDISERKMLENEQQRLIGELTEALAQIKSFCGLLPICAQCKRIRDDDGTWTQRSTSETAPKRASRTASAPNVVESSTRSWSTGADGTVELTAAASPRYLKRSASRSFASVTSPRRRRRRVAVEHLDVN